MHAWHSSDNNCNGSASDYTQKVREDGEWGSRARSSKLVKQIADLTMLPYIYSHPLKAPSLPSISSPPPLPCS